MFLVHCKLEMQKEKDNFTRHCNFLFLYFWFFAHECKSKFIRLNSRYQTFSILLFDKSSYEWKHKRFQSITHCDLARLHLWHKTCGVDFTPGSLDWTVRLNAFTVHVVPARIKQLLEWGEPAIYFSLPFILICCVFPKTINSLRML